MPHSSALTNASTSAVFTASALRLSQIPRVALATSLIQAGPAMMELAARMVPLIEPPFAIPGT